jgi:hypothetical protein
MDVGTRISMIRDASDLMKRAAAMVESATKGTGYGRRGKASAGGIRKIISSKKDGDSLTNIAKDMEFDREEHPEWTRPLVSVKNVNLKDI